jgi:predicted RND superfamily exporter protein
MLQKPIETLMNRIFSFCYRSPWIVIGLLLIITSAALLQIKDITIDSTLDRILVKDSPEMLVYEESVASFGSDKSALLFFHDPMLFTPEKLKLIQKLVWRLQKNTAILKVQSVFTSSFINNDDGSLSTEPLFTTLDNQNIINGQLNKVELDPFHHNRLINTKENALAIILELDTKLKGHIPLAKELDSEIISLRSNFHRAYQTGNTSIELFSKQEMRHSQLVFLPLIALVLFISFLFFIKSADAFFTTIIVTLLSTLWSFSLLPILNIPIQLMINIVPGIILILSATEIIHLFTSKQEAQNQSKDIKGNHILSFVAKDIGAAVCLTFLTTAIGFLSIYFNDIQMLKEFGLVTFLGLICAFICTVLYFPLHLRLFNRAHLQKSGKNHGIFLRLKYLLHKLYHSFFTHPTGKLLIIIFCLVNIFYARQVEVDNDTYSMLSERTQEKKDINHYQQYFGGTRVLYGLIKIKSGKTFKNPENLQKLWDLHRKLEDHPDIEHVQSYASLVALLHREMNDGNSDFYFIPRKQNIIEQYMLTLSVDDISPFITTDNQEVNIKISHDVSSSKGTQILVSKIEALLVEAFPAHTFHTTITSKNYLNLKASDTMVGSQAYSLTFMILVIVTILSLYFKSLKVGLISLIPNLFPIIGLFGVMGFFGVPLNIGTCIVASITIGIAADDTIHLFSRYFKEIAKGHSPRRASLTTIDHEVVPIATTSFSLALSFFVFIFAKFVPLTQFGLLSSYVLVLALISDLYIGPIILTLTTKSE